MAPDVARIWRRLEILASDHRSRTPSSYSLNPDVLNTRTLSIDDMTLDWSLQKLDQEVFETLVDLSETINLQEHLRRQFAGEIVNATEQQAALHTAMRGTPSSRVEFDDEVSAVRDELIGFFPKRVTGNRDELQWRRVHGHSSHRYRWKPYRAKATV